VQTQTQSSELTYASQLGWSSGKAEKLIAEILQIIDSKRLPPLFGSGGLLRRWKWLDPWT
jgi:hypothetical protein